MKVWVRKCHSFEEEREADREFWAQFTPSERIAMVEELRQQELRRMGQRDKRLRRVARVVKAPWG